VSVQAGIMSFWGKVMRIFVSGGAGFIGSHLCERFLKDGHFVTAFDNLVLGKQALIQAFGLSKRICSISIDSNLR